MDKNLEDLTIIIHRNSEGDLNYDIYETSELGEIEMEEVESSDGGICTGTIKNAIKSACDMALTVVKRSKIKK